MLLLLDNYDSFTWNLAQYLGELGADPLVVRNDQLTIDEAIASGPQAIVISPGPGTPADAGIAVPLVRRAAQEGIPLLGVCLGHQAIGEAFGGQVVRADRLMHGKAGAVAHRDPGLFAGLPDPLAVMRYHSLVVSPGGFPAELEITAWSTDREPEAEVMALRHREASVWGVQFHPESVGTPDGKRLLANFLVLAGISPR
jgi:anthranilate synthase/aminodeoxychorismate synthase-like glutamine amidotransferase